MNAQLRAHLKQQIDARRRVIVAIEPSDGLCDMCGGPIPDDGKHKRFCRSEHQRKFHGLYKKVIA